MFEVWARQYKTTILLDVIGILVSATETCCLKNAFLSMHLSLELHNRSAG